MDIDIPEDDAARLRTLTRLPEDAELPPKVEKAYWELKRLSDRVQDYVSISDLKYLAYQLGYGKVQETPETVADLYRRKAIKHDDPVIVKWRNGERDGRMKGVTSNGQVVVQMEGDSEERTFAPEKVRVPELATA